MFTNKQTQKSADWLDELCDADRKIENLNLNIKELEIENSRLKTEIKKLENYINGVR